MVVWRGHRKVAYSMQRDDRSALRVLLQHTLQFQMSFSLFLQWRGCKPAHMHYGWQGYESLRQKPKLLRPSGRQQAMSVC